MVLGKINRLYAGSIWRFGRQELAGDKGLIRRRRAMREWRLVNWRPRSSMRQGAKSKGFEHPAGRSRHQRLDCQETPPSPIDMTREEDGQAAVGGALTRSPKIKGNVVLYA
jgi:hypothetical protein